MEEGEKRIKQEDCSEDNLGSGILTLTNKRLAFDKTRARLMDFSKHMGDKGILNLLKNNRKAQFVSVITYCDEKILQSFYGKLDGTISKSQKGKGWGYDPIFIPKNSKKTFAEINNKNELSHRYQTLKKIF